MSQLSFDGFGVASEAEPKPDVVVAEWYKGRVLSHSSVKTYRECPQKWKFRYIDKVPDKPKSFFSFGKSVHSALEFLFDRERTAPPSLQETLDRYQASWLREGYETPAQEKWFFQEGERILRGYYVKHSTDFSKVIEVERKFTISVDGVPVMGFIDRIDRAKGGGLGIVDYKTGKAFDKSRVRTDPQLTLYQIACETALGQPVETLTLYHLNSLTPLTVPAHSASMVQNVKSSIVEAAHGISDAKFDPKPDAQGVCRYCDYQQICPAIAARPKSTSTPAVSSRTADLADRFGKIDTRIRELDEERKALGTEIAGHLRAAGESSVTGKHFSVELSGEGVVSRPVGPPDA